MCLVNCTIEFTLSRCVIFATNVPIDKTEMLFFVLERDNNYNDGLALWNKMQEADVTPSQKFVRNLCSLCTANNKEIPSDLAMLLGKETRQATL